MTPVLWEIHARQIGGRLRRWLRLIRQPRYLAGLLIGLAWIGWWLRPVWSGHVRVEVGHGLLHDLPPEMLVLARAAAGLVIAVILTVAWVVPLGGSSLRLSEAEAQWLLPAPLERRQLVQYALLRSQPGILLGSLLMTVFLGRGSPAERLLVLPAYWLLLTLWDAHMKIRSLWWGRVRELPPPRARRRVLILGGVVVGLWVPVLASLLRFVDEAAWTGDLSRNAEDLMAHVGAAWARAADAGWGDDLLSLLASVIEPLLAATPSGRALGLLVPAALVLVHYRWAARFRTRFEEAAVAREQARSARRSPLRDLAGMSVRRRRRAPFRLAEDGRPVVAVLWKNLLQTGRLPMGRAAAAVPVLMLAVALGPLPFGRAVPFVVLAMIGALLVPFLGVLSVFQLRNDFRTDLLHLEVVRTWPLEPASLALAEIAGPVVVCARRQAVALSVVIAADLGLRLHGGPGTHAGTGLLPPDVSLALGVPDLLLVPLLAVSAAPPVVALGAVAAGVMNLTTLLFPSWVQLGNVRRGGAAQLGQGLLIFWAVFFCLLIAALPAAFLVGLVLALHALLEVGPSGWELPVVALLAAAPLLVAAGGMALLCGRVWSRLDPSAEVLSGETE